MISIHSQPVGGGWFSRPARHLLRIEGETADLHALVAVIQIAIEQGGNEAVIAADPPVDVIVRNRDKRSNA